MGKKKVLLNSAKSNKNLISSSKNKSREFRTGKWTNEEEDQ